MEDDDTVELNPKIEEPVISDEGSDSEGKRSWKAAKRSDSEGELVGVQVGLRRPIFLNDEAVVGAVKTSPRQVEQNPATKLTFDALKQFNSLSDKGKYVLKVVKDDSGEHLELSKATFVGTLRGKFKPPSGEDVANVLLKAAEQAKPEDVGPLLDFLADDLKPQELVGKLSGSQVQSHLPESTLFRLLDDALGSDTVQLARSFKETGTGHDVLLEKLSEKGIGKAENDPKLREAKAAKIALLSHALGPERAKELAVASLRAEIKAMTSSSMNIDARFRAGSVAVDLYTGAVFAAMPDLAPGGSVIHECMGLLAKVEKDNFAKNSPLVDRALTFVENAWGNAPQSVKDLNKRFEAELTQLFSAAKEHAAPAKQSAYSQWNVDDQVTKQLIDFLFLRVVNPSISNSASAIDKQNEGVEITKLLQIAVNKPKGRYPEGSTEMNFVNALHERMKALVT
ncbi:MAG: hypothetical protein JSR37_09045 [Verrucomicrobia bacterium]|nr:hypothetical protein [Verrucomicrobiota bacterium]